LYLEERKEVRNNQEKREFTPRKGYNPNWDNEKRNYNPKPYRNYDNQDSHDTTEKKNEKREFSRGNSHPNDNPKPYYKHQEKPLPEKPPTEIKQSTTPTEDSGSWRKKPAAMSPVTPINNDDGFEVVSSKKKKGSDKR